MDFLIWIIVVNLLPLSAMGLAALRRARVAIPWLALATVTVGTVQSFSSSNTLVDDGSIGVGLGWLATTIYGLVGLGLVLGYVRLRPAPFVPLGAIVAGIIYVGSFYSYLPPFSSGLSGMLVFTAPGLLLVAYGAVLWHRHGLAGSMRGKSLSQQLALALGIVVGFGAIGLLAYQTDRNDPGPLFANPLDLPRLAATSMLVMEGVVVHQESQTNEFQRPNGRTGSVTYTLYRIEPSQFWRGTEPEPVLVAVDEFSPVDLKPGQPYLLFFSEKANQEDFPGHWWLFDPQQVWSADGGSFHPYPGLSPATPITRQRLTEVLEANPNR